MSRPIDPKDLKESIDLVLSVLPRDADTPFLSYFWVIIRAAQAHLAELEAGSTHIIHMNIEVEEDNRDLDEPQSSN